MTATPDKNGLFSSDGQVILYCPVRSNDQRNKRRLKRVDTEDTHALRGQTRLESDKIRTAKASDRTPLHKATSDKGIRTCGAHTDHYCLSQSMRTQMKLRSIKVEVDFVDVQKEWPQVVLLL